MSYWQSARYPFGRSLPNGVTVEHLPPEATAAETKRAVAIRDSVVAASSSG